MAGFDVGLETQLCASDRSAGDEYAGDIGLHRVGVECGCVLGASAPNAEHPKQQIVLFVPNLEQYLIHLDVEAFLRFNPLQHHMRWLDRNHAGIHEAGDAALFEQ